MSKSLAERVLAVLTVLWRWTTTHRPTWYVIATVSWTAVMGVFVQPVTAVLCGLAFGAVSALTLPAAPAPVDRSTQPRDRT